PSASTISISLRAPLSNCTSHTSSGGAGYHCSQSLLKVTIRAVSSASGQGSCVSEPPHWTQFGRRGNCVAPHERHLPHVKLSSWSADRYCCVNAAFTSGSARGPQSSAGTPVQLELAVE